MKKITESKEMIMQEYKNNLPEYLQARLEALVSQISNMEPSKGLTSIEINFLLRPPSLTSVRPKYTADEMQIIFDYYKEAMVAVNRQFVYPPTKENFCAFAGISTSAYNSYLNSTDEDKQEIMIMIDDFIREGMLTGAQVGELKEITTLFRGKTAHGMVEATAPIIVEHKHETSTSEIQRRLEALRQGQSFKSIELKAVKDGVYKQVGGIDD